MTPYLSIPFYGPDVITHSLAAQFQHVADKALLDAFSDLTANCPELRERIFQGLIAFRKEHPSWFSRFIKNLQKNFSDMTADGVLMISSQRPPGAFSRLVDAQFGQYVLATFQEFLEVIGDLSPLASQRIND